jgi:hypothetical protein
MDSDPADPADPVLYHQCTRGSIAHSSVPHHDSHPEESWRCPAESRPVSVVGRLARRPGVMPTITRRLRGHWSNPLPGTSTCRAECRRLSVSIKEGTTSGTQWAPAERLRGELMAGGGEGNRKRANEPSVGRDLSLGLSRALYPFGTTIEHASQTSRPKRSSRPAEHRGHCQDGMKSSADIS